MTSTRRIAGQVALALVLAALTPDRLGAQVEGPLDNDSYLPVDSLAEAELARGDQAFLFASDFVSRDGGEAARATLWVPVCEAWRNALVRSRNGASANPRPVVKPGEPSPWPLVEGTGDRFTEGVEEAVFRRLAALPQPGQLSWRERFDPLAVQALERAGASFEALARLERELPATVAAAKAALLLAEIAFERGELGASRRWLARARRHAAAFEPADAQVLGAITLREALAPKPEAPARARFESASSLEFVAGRELESVRGPAPKPRPLGAGPQAGLAFLGGDRVLLQTPSAVWLLCGADASLSGPFENEVWLRPAGFEVEPTLAPGNAPGWRLDPASNGASAVVVAGRSLEGRSNVLACIDSVDPDNGPTLRWALAAAEATNAADASASGDEFEFQPGPLWTEGLVIVLVRRSSSSSREHELELRALAAESGALRWRAYLGKGGERVPDSGRFVRRGVAAMPAEPLLASSAGIFASAQLGFAALIDPLDGRARFAVRNRRHESKLRGWTGWGSSLSDSGDTIAWAPADAEHLYLLDVSGPGRRGTPLVAAPEALGDAEALISADGGQALVLSRNGARHALAQWDLRSGSRRNALQLGPEESFSGRALATPQRVFAASERALYMFDRGADLALLCALPLGGPLPRGGNVWAEGARVFVLSNRRVEVFAAR